MMTRSNIAIAFAMVFTVAPIVAAANNPQIPLWSALLMSVVLGVPLFLVGCSRSENQPENLERTKHFWPTPGEQWGVLALFVFIAAMLVPALFFVPLFLFLPPGDNWTIVAVRLSLLTLTGGLAWCWISFAKKKIPEFFRGKLSDAGIDSLTQEETTREPTSVKEALLVNWELLFLTAMAMLVVFGVAHLNNFGMNVGGGRRRFAAIMKALVWCRGNPNTVRSSAALVGLVSMTLYSTRVYRAYTRSSDPTPAGGR